MNTQRSSLTKSNNGFTLIELIVTMAILVIFAAGLIALFGYSLAQYKNTNDQTNIQHESQLCSKQLESVVCTANKSLVVCGFDNGVMTQGNDTIVVYSVETEKKGDQSVETKYREVIYFEKAEDAEVGKIMYQKYYYDDTKTGDDKWEEIDSPETFASFVDSVQYTVYDKDDKEILTIQNNYEAGKYSEKALAYKDVTIHPAKVSYNIVYKSGERTFDSHNSTAVRNKVLGTNNYNLLFPTKAVSPTT